MNYIVFDIETANPPIDWRDYQALGVSWAVCYLSQEDRYHHYRATGIQAMAAKMAATDLLVSWNGIGFDIPLLLVTLDKLELPYPDTLEKIPHCDLMALVEQEYGAKLSLGEVATWTLGQGKIGSGAHAPELARQGLWDELASYCEHDVWLTKRLFEFARQHGYLLCEGNQRIGIQVPGGVPAKLPVGEPASERQLRYLADLQHQAGIEVKVAGLTKGQARREIERLKKAQANEAIEHSNEK